MENEDMKKKEIKYSKTHYQRGRGLTRNTRETVVVKLERDSGRLSLAIRCKTKKKHNSIFHLPLLGKQKDRVQGNRLRLHFQHGRMNHTSGDTRSIHVR